MKKKSLLVGGMAMRKHGLELARNSLDYDYICTIDRYEAFVRSARQAGSLISAGPIGPNKMVVKLTANRIFEFEIAWYEGDWTSAEHILEYNKNEKEGIANLQTLLMLKLSHRYLKNSPHFHKTMSDIKKLREHVSERHFSKKLKKIQKIREKETYTYKHPSLMRSKTDFFDASVPYKYDHDSIHKVICYDTVPAYESFKGDTAEVFCDKKKFFNTCTNDQRLQSVAEEAMVLAIERSLVPFPNAKTPHEAFLYALMKVCTSITSGWFREFAWENYHDVVKIYRDDYFARFNNAVENGKVPLHGEA